MEISRIKLKPEFTFGLYLYLRQLNLSIDRGLHVEWSKLVDYLQLNGTSNNVLEYFYNNQLAYSNHDRTVVHLKQGHCFFQKAYQLSKNELNYVFNTLY